MNLCLQYLFATMHMSLELSVLLLLMYTHNNVLQLLKSLPVTLTAVSPDGK
jgi:hypothetical protein